MVLLIDNFDSFTYNLYDYILQTGATCEVVRNTIDKASLKKINPEGLVLSPGPGIPKKSGNLMFAIDYYKTKIPILGICLGHQAIGEYFGATLLKAEKPMHGKTSTIFLQSDYLFKNIRKKTEVMRYHSLILTQLPDALECIAATENGEIMALRHKNLNLRGLQFHPEAWLTKHGKDMLNNWINHNKLALKNMPK